MEESLYNILTKNAQNIAEGASAPLSQSEKDEIVAQINQFSAYRIGLYRLISSNYHSQMVSETSATTTAETQLTTLRLLEKEMNKAKRNLAKLKGERLNSMKMVEINTYYSKQYYKYKIFMQTVAIIMFALIICTVIRLKFSEKAGNILFTLVSAVGICVLLYELIDMYRRSWTEYDTYIWPLAPTTSVELQKAQESSSVVDISGSLIGVIPDVCVGTYCCGEGTTWSDVSGCVVNDNITIR